MRNADGTEMDFSGQGIERLRQEKEAFERSVGRPVHDFEWFSALYREMPFRNPAYHALFALLEGAACRCCSTAPAARTAQVSGPC